MAAVVDAPAEAAGAAPAPPPLTPLLPGALPTEDDLRGIASWSQLLAMAGISGPAAQGFMDALEPSFWEDLEEWTWAALVEGVETTVRPRTQSLGQAGIARRLAVRLHERALGLDKAPTPLADPALPVTSSTPTPPGMAFPLEVDADTAEAKVEPFIVRGRPRTINARLLLHAVSPTQLAWLHKDTSKQARVRAGACRFVALRTQLQSELEADA